MQVPDPKTVTASRYCEEVTVRVLDRKFLQFLQSHIPDIKEMAAVDGVTDEILAYLVDCVRACACMCVHVRV